MNKNTNTTANAIQDTTLCAICGEPLRKYDKSDASPVASGRCCDACRARHVVPARIEAAEAVDGTLHGVERLRACVDFLCSVYGVDKHGLADMLGINRAVFTRSYNSDDAGQWVYSVLYGCYRLSGVSIEWLTR